MDSFDKLFFQVFTVLVSACLLAIVFRTLLVKGLSSLNVLVFASLFFGMVGVVVGAYPRFFEKVLFSG